MANPIITRYPSLDVAGAYTGGGSRIYRAANGYYYLFTFDIDDLLVYRTLDLSNGFGAVYRQHTITNFDVLDRWRFSRRPGTDIVSFVYSSEPTTDNVNIEYVEFDMAADAFQNIETSAITFTNTATTPYEVEMIALPNHTIVSHKADGASVSAFVHDVRDNGTGQWIGTLAWTTTGSDPGVAYTWDAANNRCHLWAVHYDTVTSTRQILHRSFSDTTGTWEGTEENSHAFDTDVGTPSLITLLPVLERTVNGTVYFAHTDTAEPNALRWTGSAPAGAQILANATFGEVVSLTRSPRYPIGATASAISSDWLIAALWYSTSDAELGFYYKDEVTASWTYHVLDAAAGTDSLATAWEVEPGVLALVRGSTDIYLVSLNSPVITTWVDPVDGDVVWNEERTLKLDVSTEVGESISTVAIYEDDVLLGNASFNGTSGYWEYTWTPPGLGPVSLRAEATDTGASEGQAIANVSVIRVGAPEATTLTGYTGAVADVRDDPDAPDANWLTQDDAGATDGVVLATFPLPGSPLHDGAGQQSFRVWVRKQGAGGDPDPLLDVELREGGALVRVLATNVAITSTTGQLLAYTWASTELIDTSGADAEIRLVATRGSVFTPGGTYEYAPDTAITVTNFTQTGATALALVDDDPQAPGGDWLLASANDVTNVLHVGFPTPPGDLSLGAGLQTMRLYVRSSQSGSPTMNVEVRENGVTRATLATGVTVSSQTGSLFTYTWNASALADPSGADVELWIQGVGPGGGNPGNRGSLEVDAVEWEAVVADFTAYPSGVDVGAVEWGAGYASAGITGTADLTLPMLTVTATGAVSPVFSGSAALTLPMLTGSGTATNVQAVNLSATLTGVGTLTAALQVEHVLGTTATGVGTFTADLYLKTAIKETWEDTPVGQFPIGWTAAGALVGVRDILVGGRRPPGHTVDWTRSGKGLFSYNQNATQTNTAGAWLERDDIPSHTYADVFISGRSNFSQANDYEHIGCWARGNATPGSVPSAGYAAGLAGNDQVRIWRIDGPGSYTLLDEAPLPGGKTWGEDADPWHLRMVLDGNTYKVRAWQGHPEPATWDIEGVDNTYASGERAGVYNKMIINPSVYAAAAWWDAFAFSDEPAITALPGTWNSQTGFVTDHTFNGEERFTITPADVEAIAGPTGGQSTQKVYVAPLLSNGGYAFLVRRLDGVVGIYGNVALMRREGATWSEVDAVYQDVSIPDFGNRPEDADGQVDASGRRFIWKSDTDQPRFTLFERVGNTLVANTVSLPSLATPPISDPPVIVKANRDFTILTAACTSPYQPSFLVYVYAFDPVTRDISLLQTLDLASDFSSAVDANTIRIASLDITPTGEWIHVVIEPEESVGKYSNLTYQRATPTSGAWGVGSLHTTQLGRASSVAVAADADVAAYFEYETGLPYGSRNTETRTPGDGTWVPQSGDFQTGWSIKPEDDFLGYGNLFGGGGWVTQRSLLPDGSAVLVNADPPLIATETSPGVWDAKGLPNPDLNDPVEQVEYRFEDMAFPRFGQNDGLFFTVNTDFEVVTWNDPLLVPTLSDAWLDTWAVGTGTFSADFQPAFRATAALTLPALTAAATATVAPPEYTATANVTLPALTAAATGTVAPPEYAASAALTLPALTAAGTAVVQRRITASAALALPMLTATGAGEQSPPALVGTAALTLPMLTGTGAATVAPPQFTAALAATLPMLTASGAGTVAPPEFTGTATAILPSLQASGAATVQPPTFTASADVTLPALQAAGAAIVTPPGITASADLTLPALTASATGTVQPPAGRTATADLTLPMLTASGTGTFEPGDREAAAAAILPMLTLAGTATVTPPTFTASAALTLPALQAVANATVQPFEVNGVVDITLPALQGAGTGVVTRPEFTATLAAALPMLALTATGVQGIARPHARAPNERAAGAPGRKRSATARASDRAGGVGGVNRTGGAAGTRRRIPVKKKP